MRTRLRTKLLFTFLAIIFTMASHTALATNIPVGQLAVVDTISISAGAPSAALSPDQSKLYAGVLQGADKGYIGTIDIVDTASKNVESISLDEPGYPMWITLSPDGSRAYVAVTQLSNPTLGYCHIEVFDTVQKRVIAKIPLTSTPYGPSGIVLKPDGSRAYVANQGPNRVEVIDTTSNTLIKSIYLGPNYNNPIGIAITPDGSRVYTSNRYTCDLSVIDTQSDTVIQTIPVSLLRSTSWTSIDISPNGELAYVTHATDSRVAVIDINPQSSTYNQQIGTIETLSSNLRQVTFSDDGKLAFACGYYEMLVIDSDPASPTFNTVLKHIPAYAPAGVVFRGTVPNAVAYSINRTISVIGIPDTEAPEITISSPEAFGVYPSGDIPFAFSATDAYSGVANVSATLQTPSGTINVQNGETKSLSPGTYTLTVTAIDNKNNTASKSIIFTVNNAAPIVDAGPDQTIDEGQTVNLSGTATDPDVNDTLTYSWDFGDGTTAEGANTTHIYADNGSYTATLTVTDNHGASSSDTLVATVNNVAPTVEAGLDQIVNEGQIVNLSGTATDPGANDTLTYSWDFGDGTSAAGTDVSHTYADNGIYKATLTVTDKDGAVSTDNLNVTVNNVAPTVDAGPDQTVLWGDNIAFSGSSTDPGSDTFSYQWNFGDGSVTSEQNSNHAYSQPGVYTVTYIVSDDDGGIGTDSLTVTVNQRSSSEKMESAVTQYSDPVDLITTLLTDTGDPITNANIDFKVNSSPVGSSVTDDIGKAILNTLINLETGTYPTESDFNGNDLYQPSSANANLAVNKEDSTLNYNGQVIAAYGSSVNLSAIINQDSDGHLGDITKATPVEFQLMNANGTYTTVTAPTTEMSPGVGLAAATAGDLPPDVYKVIVKLGANNYYEAPATQSVLVVYNPDAGSVTGGGWIIKSGQKSNFGFNAKYKNDGSLQGSLTMTDKSSGNPIQIKAASLDWLVVRNDFQNASFAGKCQINGQGNYDFQVDVVDNGEPGTTDTFLITVSNGYDYEASGTLAGGNIQIQQ